LLAYEHEVKKNNNDADISKIEEGGEKESLIQDLEREKARFETEFKAALHEALKLSPEGRLARELLERYTKEGF